MQRAQLGFWASLLAALSNLQQMNDIVSRARRKPTAPPQTMQEHLDALEALNEERMGDALRGLSKPPS